MEYTINDLSHIGARRLSVTVFVQENGEIKWMMQRRTVSKREMRILATEITELMKKSDYYRNEITKEHFKGKSADVIWIFAAFNKKDEEEGKWICRTEWISPYLIPDMRPEPLTALKGKIMEQLDNGIKIAWDVPLKECSKMVITDLPASVQENLKTMTGLWEEVIETVYLEDPKMLRLYISELIEENNDGKYKEDILVLSELLSNLEGK